MFVIRFIVPFPPTPGRKSENKASEKGWEWEIIEKKKNE